MQRSTMSCLVSLSVLTAPALAPEVLFAPKPGLQVERRIESSWTSELESWTARMGGEDVPSEYLPKLGLRSTNTLTFDVVDEYLASSDGKPIRLRREYRELAAVEAKSMTMNGQGPFESQRKGSSAVEGCVVLFDESEKAAVARSLDYGECDAGELAKLEIDLDFTAFLPAESSSTSWSVPVSRFNPFNTRFAGVSFEYDVEEDRKYLDEEELEDNATGEWRVQPRASRTLDGVTCLVFELEGTFTSRCEIDAELRDVPVAKGPTKETGAYEIELRGELIWNSEQRVLRGLTLAGDTRLVHTTKTVEVNAAGAAAYEQEMHFTGKVNMSVDAKISP